MENNKQDKNAGLQFCWSSVGLVFLNEISNWKWGREHKLSLYWICSTQQHNNNGACIYCCIYLFMEINRVHANRILAGWENTAILHTSFCSCWSLRHGTIPPGFEAITTVTIWACSALTIHGHFIYLSGVVLLNVTQDTNVIILHKVDGHAFAAIPTWSADSVEETDPEWAGWLVATGSKFNGGNHPLTCVYRVLCY